MVFRSWHVGVCWPFHTKATSAAAHCEQDNMVEAAPEEIHEDDLEFDIELADITTTDVIVATQHDGVDDHSSASF